jgi:hypothetical protein
VDAGDVVVTDGQLRLMPGVKVEPKTLSAMMTGEGAAKGAVVAEKKL